jgi:myo-inositol 2-dehydrogenase/D-chiro-inositol 1-dehydrogenase
MSRGAGDRVRLGVVGLGTVAQVVHLPLIATLRDRFQVTAVCDLSDQLAVQVGERFGLGGAARCRSAEELLDSGLVDAALVLSSGSHGEVAGAALGRSLPVLCEKPLAYTLAEADELARLSERTGTPLQLGYMKLHDPAVRRAARELATSRPALRSVEVTVLHPAGASQLEHAGLAGPPGDVPAAALDALQDRTARLRAQALGPAPAALGRLYTDVLLGSVVHDLAVVRELAGDPERVEYVDAWPDGAWESVAFQAVCPGGVRLGVRWHYLDRYPEYREEVRVHHEQGSVELTFPSPYLLNAPTVLTVSDRDGDAARVRTHRSTVEAFRQELLAFHRLVTEGEPPAAGIAEGRADILTCQRIVRSLAAGRGIDLGGEAVRA